MKRIAIAIFALLAAFAAGTAHAATAPYLTPYSSFQTWLPVTFIAMLVSLSLTSIYYLIGYILNNNSIKGNAISELGQAVGTGFVVIGIILILAMFGTSALSFLSIVSPVTMNAICTQLSGSQINFLSTNAGNTFNGNISPTAAICSSIIAPLVTNAPTIGQGIDYGLASSYVLLSNVTNQSLSNFDSMYILSGYLGFFDGFKAITGLGWGEAVVAESSVTFSYSPLGGYYAFRSILRPMSIGASTIYYSFTVQLLFVLLLLFTWPYLLAAGIIMRSIALTRRVGGLLIAIIISALIVYPLIFLLEYASLSNPSLASPIGANQLPNLPIYEKYYGSGGVANVLIYGSSSGYVQASLIPSSQMPSWAPSGCASSGGYVYETRCGNPTTIPRQSMPGYGCKAQGTMTAWQQCHDGYVQASVCSNKYVYESVCGDSNTMQLKSAVGVSDSPNCVSAIPSGSHACPSGYVPHGSGMSPFLLPDAKAMMTYYSCWPTHTLIGEEGIFSAWYLIPGATLGTGIESILGSLVGSVPVTPTYCQPDNAMDTALGFANIFGISTVSAYILPLLNILMTLSAIAGIARLMGGDADILGISKLI